MVIEPGADPSDIRLDFDRAVNVALRPDGNLLIEAESGPDYLSTAPITFQEVDGEPVTVDSGYLVRNDGTVGFSVGAYDPELALVIDPTFVAVETAGGSYASGSTIDLPVPGSVVADDLMIAQIAYNATGAGLITPPAGWALIDETGANGITQALYWRIATAGEPAQYSFTLSSGTTDTAAGAITVYDGVDTSNPIHAGGGQANAPAVAVTAPSITTTVGGTVLVGFFAVRDDGAGTPPAGMIERTDVNSANGGAAADETLALAADEQLGVAGSTGSRTATVDASAGSIGYLVALTPAGGGPCGAADTDGDGLEDCREDADTDGDGDPTTVAGPDSDGDGTPDYRDPDDDGDGTPTVSEDADPNGDGDPRDAVDSDRDGRPDYLDAPTDKAAVVVGSEQKISSTQGGLVGPLDDTDHFGHAVAGIGDLDRDGTDDLIVGADFDDDGGPARGAAYVLFMNADGTVKAEQKISDTAGGFAGVLDDTDRFGWAVAGLGDIDGDGLNDVAVGAFQDDDGGAERGAVYVLFLNADGTVKAEQKISDTAGGFAGVLDDTDHFGWAVTGLGDLDDDGINDLAVAANKDDDGGSQRGAVYVLFLNADGTVKAEQKISDTAGGFAGVLDDTDYFGSGVGGLGDVDGDGIEDLAVGAYFDDDGGSNRGAVHVLLLNTDGTVRAEQKISNTQGGFGATLDDGDWFGVSVSGLGDVDADGTPDLVAGATFDDDGGLNQGAVHVVLLNPDGTVKADHKISETVGGFNGPLDSSDYFGTAVAGIGDLDGDGTIGLAIGADSDDDGGSGRGAVYVIDLAPTVAVVVNSTGDQPDISIGDDKCDIGSLNSEGAEACTLRAAIQEANASLIVDAIHFDIPTSESGYSPSPVAFTIQPGSLLPEVSTAMTIDGSTQAEYVTEGRPVIELDGVGVSAGEENGLWITGGGTTVRGLVLNRWGDDAIDLEANGGQHDRRQLRRHRRHRHGRPSQPVRASTSRRRAIS